MMLTNLQERRELKRSIFLLEGNQEHWMFALAHIRANAYSKETHLNVLKAVIPKYI